jgi:uncharacterized protein YqeY
MLQSLRFLRFASTTQTLIKADLMTSMRAKDKIKTTVLKSLISDLGYNEKAANKIEPQLVILKSLKQREDAAIQYRAGGREGLVSFL